MPAPLPEGARPTPGHWLLVTPTLRVRARAGPSAQAGVSDPVALMALDWLEAQARPWGSGLLRAEPAAGRVRHGPRGSDCVQGLSRRWMGRGPQGSPRALQTISPPPRRSPSEARAPGWSSPAAAIPWTPRCKCCPSRQTWPPVCLPQVAAGRPKSPADLAAEKPSPRPRAWRRGTGRPPCPRCTRKATAAAAPRSPAACGRTGPRLQVGAARPVLRNCSGGQEASRRGPGGGKGVTGSTVPGARPPVWTERREDSGSRGRGWQALRAWRAAGRPAFPSSRRRPWGPGGSGGDRTGSRGLWAAEQAPGAGQGPRGGTCWSSRARVAGAWAWEQGERQREKYPGTWVGWGGCSPGGARGWRGGWAGLRGLPGSLGSCGRLCGLPGRFHTVPLQPPDHAAAGGCHGLPAPAGPSHGRRAPRRPPPRLGRGAQAAALRAVRDALRQRVTPGARWGGPGPSERPERPGATQVTAASPAEEGAPESACASVCPSVRPEPASLPV